MKRILKKIVTFIIFLISLTGRQCFSADATSSLRTLFSRGKTTLSSLLSPPNGKVAQANWHNFRLSELAERTRDIEEFKFDDLYHDPQGEMNKQLAKDEAAGVEFFQHLLDEYDQNGHSIAAQISTFTSTLKAEPKQFHEEFFNLWRRDRLKGYAFPLVPRNDK